MRPITGTSRFLTVLSLLFLGACQRETPMRSKDTARQESPPPAEPEAAPVATTVWDTTVGPFVAVPAGSSNAAYVIFPEFTSDSALDSVSFDLEVARHVKFELFTDGQPAGTAHVATLGVERVENCTAWPTARLELDDGGGEVRSWSVGFVAGRTEPVAFDSLQGLRRADSTRVAIDLARVASTLPGDTAVAFRGRPFIVRQAHRMMIEGRQTILAEIVRTVNQEAAPLQEHLVVVAERDSASTDPYKAAYYERTIGLEDALETTELLAIARARGTRTLFILLSRYYGDGGAYALLERRGGSGWRLRWTSAYAGC